MYAIPHQRDGGSLRPVIPYIVRISGQLCWYTPVLVARLGSQELVEGSSEMDRLTTRCDGGSSVLARDSVSRIRVLKVE